MKRYFVNCWKVNADGKIIYMNDSFNEREEAIEYAVKASLFDGYYCQIRDNATGKLIGWEWAIVERGVNL